MNKFRSVTFLLLLVVLYLTEVAECVQYPLNYHYHYRARVSAAIPETNDEQLAASDIHADLHVFANSHTSVVLKFTNVQIGNFHGNVDCNDDHLTPLPVEYRAPQSDEPGHLIGQHQFALSGGNYLFHEDDPLWLINFYKSVISMFVTAPMRQQFNSTSNVLNGEGIYKTRDQTVMGECDSIYTQQKLTGLAANEYLKFAKSHIEEDVQMAPAALTSKTGRKTTGGTKTPRKTTGVKRPPTDTTQSQVQVPPLEDTVWQVIRSVELDDCSSRVEHQHTLSGVYCSLAEDQCKNLMSRNSHSVFYLRGSGGAFRLEQAVVKGAILVSPFGYESQMLQTRSVHSVALVSVSIDGIRPSIEFPCVTEENLMYRMILPYRGSNPYPEWAKLGTLRQALEQFTAHSITATEQATIESRVVGYVNAAFQIIKGIGSGPENQEAANSLLNFAAILMYDFDETQLRRTFEMAETQFSKTLGMELFMGVLAEVGSEPAVKLFLEERVEKGTGNDSKLRQVLFFNTLNKNIKSAAPLRFLLDFVKKSLNSDETPFATSQSLISLASLVSKLCVRSVMQTGSFGQFAKNQCESDNIVPELEELIISHLKATETFWKQIIFVRALVQLKTSGALEALWPYIHGTTSCDTTVRLVALEALASWQNYGYQNIEILTLNLLELFENTAEDKRVRARALGFLVSWPLSSTIWSRLAFSTHRPMLRDLSAFTYSIIKTTAELKHHESLQQSLFASHALRLAKPASVARRYSSYQTFSQYSFEEKISLLGHIETTPDPMSPLPAHIVLYLRQVLGGAGFHSKLDMSLANDKGDVENIAIDLILGMKRGYQDFGKSGDWDRYLSMMTAGLDIDKRARDAIVGFADIVPHSGMEFMLPFEHEFLSDAMKTVFDSSYIEMNNPFFFYYNNYDSTFVTVNDLGLPVIATIAAPVLLAADGEFSFRQSGNEQYTSYSDRFVLGMSGIARNNIEAMTLWSGTKVATGVAHGKNVMAPFNHYATITLPHSNRERVGAEVYFSVSQRAPAQETEVPLVTVSNVPYTVLRAVDIGDLEMLKATSKPVLSKDMASAAPLEIPLWNGLSFSTNDARSLSTLKNIGEGAIKTLVKPRVTLWNWSLKAKLCREKPVGLFFNLTYSPMDSDQKGNDMVCHGSEDIQDVQQTGQGADDYDYFGGQQQSSQDLEFQSFGSFGQQTQQAPQKLVEQYLTDAEIARSSFGAPDATSPILDTYLPYLRREKGWRNPIHGISARVEFGTFKMANYVPELVDAEACELALAVTSCFEKDNYDQFHSKGVYVLACSNDPCSTVCEDLEITHPVITDLDTLESINQKDLTQTMKIGFYVGPKCKDGPIVDGNDYRRLSNASYARLMKSLTSCDDIGANGDPVQDFARKAYYDSLEFDMEIHKNAERSCPRHKTEKFIMNFIATNMAATVTSSEQYLKWGGLRGFTKRTIIAKRTKGHDFAVLETRITDDESGLQETYHIESPKYVEEMLNKVVLIKFDYGDYCVFNETSLTTFDGLRVSYTPDHCPALAVTSCEEGSHDTFAVGVSKSMRGGLAITIVGRFKRMAAILDGNSVVINGERVPDDVHYKDIEVQNGYGGKETVGVLVKNGKGSLKFDIFDTVTVLLKEGSVFIKVSSGYKDYVCGLCGNHDLEPINDMKQPNGCLLTDPEKFLKSWVPSSSFQCFNSGADSAEFCLKEEPLIKNPDAIIPRVY